jgi:uncharacterized protein
MMPGIPGRGWTRLQIGSLSLICHENMKEDLAYRIVKTIFEHQPELAAIQREARFLTLASRAGGGSPVPYHPGALRYFAERGIKTE